MKFQKVFLVLLSSLFIIFPTRFALNCVDYPSTDNIRVVHFFKDIFEFNDLYPFIYETEHTLYESSLNANRLSEADRLNIADWKTKINDEQVNDKDIVSFLYELNPATYWQHQSEWDRSNPFLKTTKSKHPEIYDYLQIVKESEMLIGNATIHTWDYEYDRFELSDIIQRVEQSLANTQDDFLKRRYAYKLLSLYYYNLGAAYETDSTDQSLLVKFHTLFETHFLNGTKDWLYYSALHYYGQMTEGDFLLESYMYGKDKRARTATIISKDYLEETIKANKNPKKTASCLAIQSLTNPGPNLKNLRRIYALDPQNRDFNFLITREVNKLENWLWTKKMSDFEYDQFLYYFDEEKAQLHKNHNNDLIYSREVSTFLKQVYFSRNIPEEDKLFLSIAITYIEILNGALKDANHFLIRDLGQYKNPKYELQAKVIITLLDMYSKGVSPLFETDLLALLKEIRLTTTLDSPDLYYAQLIRTVAEYYKTKAEFRAKGFLLESRTSLVVKGAGFMEDIYDNTSVNDIDNIFSIIRKKDKTPFEHFITQGVDEYRYDYREKVTEELSPLDTMRLLDYKGIKLMRQNKLTEALNVYKNLTDSILNKEPFSYINDDVFMFRYRHNGEYLYNKKTFLEQLISYKEALKKNPNDALINYYVGNAYLNMTITGNAWPMLSNYITERVTAEEYAKSVNHHYIYGDWAIPYFEKALLNVKDKKLKVLIQINLAYIKNLHITEKKQQEQTLKKLCSDKEEEENLLLVVSNCDIYYDYIAKYTRKGDRIARRQIWNGYYY